MEERPTTEEGAANVALSVAKQPPLALLTDNSDRARAIKAVFATARDAMLRQKNWNFATGWVVPAQAAGVVHPSPRKNVFKLPQDCLKVRFVENQDNNSWESASYGTDPANLQAEVPVLLTNLSAPITLCYTRCITAVRLWDPEFLNAWAHRCAELAGPQLGLSATRVEALRSAADAYRDEAAITDAQEKAPRVMSRSTSFTRARVVGGSRGHRP